MTVNMDFKPERTKKQKITALKALLKLALGFIPKTVKIITEDEYNKAEEVEKKDAPKDSISNNSGSSH